MLDMANMANPHGNMSSMANPHGSMGNMANPLKVSIALGQKPAIIHKGPFYLMKPEPIVMSEVTGATNLMSSKNLEHSFQKLAAKKMKDSNSSFRQLIEKPPVGGKELMLLNQLQLAGFRLHPGPLPEQYRTLLNQVGSSKEKEAKLRPMRRVAGQMMTEKSVERRNTRSMIVRAR